VPKNLTINIDWKSWEVLPIFDLIQKAGNISDEEMRKAFNLGIGLIAVVSPADSEKVMTLCKSINEKAIVIGEII
jgi:phosphoribosylformylglycinamidine cyclo-ligase